MRATILGTLLLCEVCRDPGIAGEPSLCPNCRAGLVTAPSLCRRCAGLACHPESCGKPWISQPGIDKPLGQVPLHRAEIRALLKRWKVTQSAALDRHVLRAYLPEQCGRLAALAPELVTWIPQRRSRSWSLAACPSEKIARWIARELSVPSQATTAPTRSRPGPRKAHARPNGICMGASRAVSNSVGTRPARPSTDRESCWWTIS